MTPEKYDQLALNVAQTMDDIYLRNVPATVLRDFARRLREEWMNGQEPMMRTGGGEMNIGAVTLELAHRTCTRYVHEGPITYGFTEQHMIDFAKRLVERVKADQAALTVGAEQKENEPAATAIHYPECWDTAAYPTVWDAFAEVAAWFKCSNDECAQKPPSATQAVDSSGSPHADGTEVKS